MTASPLRFDVLGIGNAIVDVLAKVDDDFLIDHDLNKGAMTLIDAERALYLYGQLGDKETQSGGSAGNTIAGIGALGGNAAYIGKVADDDLGTQYRVDMDELGVHFPTSALSEQEPTARSMIAITPDGERTMNTYLGACAMISPADMDRETIAASKITYFEGYLYDRDAAKEAFLVAADMAHEAGNKVSMTLSDSFCVDRFRSEFRELITSGKIDILLANEAELLSLYQMDDFDAALEQLRSECPLAAVTRSEKGAVAIRGSETVSAPAFEVEKVVDTTGAGDLFASGFLYGVAKEMSLEDSTRLGCLLASNIITVVGPRLSQDLRFLANAAGIRLPE